MTHNEFIRYLKSQGVEVTYKKGRHTTKLSFNGNRSQIGGHGTKEIGTGVKNAILKQLGLK